MSEGESISSCEEQLCASHLDDWSTELWVMMHTILALLTSGEGKKKIQVDASGVLKIFFYNAQGYGVFFYANHDSQNNPSSQWKLIIRQGNHRLTYTSNSISSTKQPLSKISAVTKVILPDNFRDTAWHIYEF